MIFLEKIKKIIFTFVIIIGMGLLTGGRNVLAAEYEINRFESKINLNQDFSLTVREKIEANFLVAKHGIYRVIPYIYNHNGKTIKANLRILGVTDEKGEGVNYEVSNYNQSKKIKIGDADATVLGKKEYTIEYILDQVVLDYGDGPEIYWNATGGEWDVSVENSAVEVVSDFGEITKIECFGCEKSFTKNKANFKANGEITVVVQISKNNQLKTEGFLKKIKNLVEGNWGYLVAVLPTLLMFIVWFKKGRDKKYLSENFYRQPDNKRERNVSIFDRPHLPLVYSPIENLSPAEIGTILDQKIDMKDIVAEIVELARLDFLKIKKIENKGIFGIKNTEYELIKLETNNEKLNKFQKNLLQSLFKNKDEVKVSELKNKFYLSLPTLRSDIYEILNQKKISNGNWEKVEGKWMGISFLLNFLTIFFISSVFVKKTGNAGPTIIAILGLVPSLILAAKMPRRTAWGYSLYQQIKGLKYYLGKGKWREEIMEKNLFLEEMLPIAISLGVVDRLTKDMKDLGVQPPKYFEGVVMSNFAHELNSFSSSISTNLVSTPSGKSSWSGGSGFSGGSSGGGFGGGGGGSW